MQLSLNHQSIEWVDHNGGGEKKEGAVDLAALVVVRNVLSLLALKVCTDAALDDNRLCLMLHLLDLYCSKKA